MVSAHRGVSAGDARESSTLLLGMKCPPEWKALSDHSAQLDAEDVKACLNREARMRSFSRICPIHYFLVSVYRWWNLG